MAEDCIEVKQTEKTLLHWGLVSAYRREIMGLASILVMLSHYPFRFPGSFVMQVIRTAFDSGNVGVELFLLVSGVGLCYAYEKRTSLGSFYRSRYVRLLVPYVMLCVPYWAWRDLWVGKDNFFLDVFQLTFPLKHVVTYWYITTSAGFYLVFPLIYRWINRGFYGGQKLTRQMRMSILYVVGMVALLVVMHRHPILYRNTEIGMTRILIFSVGCYLGSCVQQKRTIEGHWVLIAGAAVAGFPLLFRMTEMTDYWYRMLYAPFGVALLIALIWLFRFDWMKQVNGLLRFCGDRSIELYITHVSIGNVFETYNNRLPIDRYSLKGYILILILAVIVSVLVHPVIRKGSDLILRKR